MVDPNELLKWSIANQDSNITPEQQKERQKDFLDKLDPKWYDAIFGTGGESVMDKMKIIISALQSDDTTDEQRVNILDELEFLCERTEDANALHGLGGLEVVLDAIKHDNPNVRSNSLSVIATSTPNNEVFQNQLMELNAIEILFQTFKTDSNSTVRRKALLSVSALIRGHSDAMKQFLELDGVRAVINAVSDEELRVARRAVFLLEILLKCKHISGVDFHEMDGVNSLFRVLERNDVDIIEKSLAALKAFVEMSDSNCAILRTLDVSTHMNTAKTFCKEEKQKDPEFDSSDIIRHIVAISKATRE